MLDPIFVLIEKINDESVQTPIFARDRDIITFGRSAICEYTLLRGRDETMNRKISRMQATLKKSENGWTLHPGCIPESARENISPGRPSTPLFIGSASFGGEFIELKLGDEVFLYREVDDHALLICTDEKGLEAMSNPARHDATQSYDLIDELRTDIKRLESLVLSEFSGIRVSISTLFDSERVQNSRLDTYSKTIVKMSGAILLVFLAFVGGSQLMNQENKKDLAYDVIKLLTSTASGVGGAALLKDAIDKRTPKR